MVVPLEGRLSVSTLDDYDAQVDAMQKHNAPILASFHTSLAQAGLAKKTVKNHVDNIDFFTEYLVSYEPLTRLDEAQKPYRSLTSGRSRSKMSEGVVRGKAATLLGNAYWVLLLPRVRELLGRDEYANL